jgi:hypothetical protein
VGLVCAVLAAGPGAWASAAEERVSLRLLREKGIISGEEYQGALEEVAREEHGLPAVRMELGRGVVLTSPNRQFSLGLRARLQWYAAGVVPTTGRGGTKEANVRRMRILGGGHLLSPRLTYGFMLGFGVSDTDASNPVPVMDATVAWALLRDLNVQVGQWTVWMSRGQGDRAFSRQMVERSPVAQELSLDRDVGVGVFSNDFLGMGGRLGYAVGLYGGQGRNRVAGAFSLWDQRPAVPRTRQDLVNDAVDGHFGAWTDPRPNVLAAGRLRVSPLGGFDEGDEADLDRSSRPRLSAALGGAFLQGARYGRGHTGERYALEGFDYWMGSLDVVFKWAGFSLVAEVITRFSDRSRRTGKVAGHDVTEYARSATGVWVQSGYMLTDHLEVTGRLGELVPWRDTDPRLKRTHEVAVGLGFYAFKQALKVQADYTYLAGHALEDGNHLGRVQVSLSP